MNSGLPSLLDAIFGKQDLDSVSLEEMYDLISEFPSFNAGHFLLSKKLKHQNEKAYERETMRTALYFNNPFWLQSILNEETYEEIKKTERRNSLENGEPLSTNENIEGITQVNSSVPTEEITEIKTTQFFQQEETGTVGELAEPPSGFLDIPVNSFDDLISKYKIQPQEQTEEVFPAPRPEQETSQTEGNALSGQTGEEQTPEKQDFELIPGIISQGGPENFIPEGNSDSYEIREEIINEYGIFEEVIVEKPDFDLDAFDRPGVSPSTREEETEVIPQDSELPVERAYEEGYTPDEIQNEVSENIIESSSPDQTVSSRAEADYDAFDRPIDKKIQEEVPEEEAYNQEFIAEEESIMEIYSGKEDRLESMETAEESDDTGDSDFTSAEEDSSGNTLSAGLAERLNEHKKTIPPFDPKSADSIVFAPYHMIDYFASQGIKLVMEENPADPFGKQLKSFTDWLKVMKKLPAQSISEKPDEKEVDRIRHFAAHSIDEREILTESMAEVLAKQGMYENAIALYQKLSLIYPPKSAYFASRIEQLKASLP